MRYLFLALIPLAYGLVSQPAQAIFNVTSPEIKVGVLGVESRNRWDQDDRPSKDGFAMHALRIDYGFTKRFGIEVTGFLKDVPSHGHRYDATEFEGEFRFYEPGDYWLDFGLKLAYEIGGESSDADAIKAKLLFQKALGAWVYTANVNFSQKVGPQAQSDLEGSLGWRTRYNMGYGIDPGFEYYASYGELSELGAYSDQSHRIGPMFYGDIAPGLTYQAGYLFGISHATEDGSAKLFLRYEISL